MAAENLKSPQITNLDETPPFANTAGEDGVGLLRALTQSIAPTDGATIGSTYLMARLPTVAKVKHVLVDNAGVAGVGTYDVGLAYSDAPNVTSPDGTPPSEAGSIISTTLFASAWSGQTAQAEPADLIQQSGSFVATQRQEPLWKAAGLTIDPGGFMDVLLTSTAAPTASGTITVEVQFVV